MLRGAGRSAFSAVSGLRFTVVSYDIRGGFAAGGGGCGGGEGVGSGGGDCLKRVSVNVQNLCNTDFTHIFISSASVHRANDRWSILRTPSRFRQLSVFHLLVIIL